MACGYQGEKEMRGWFAVKKKYFPAEVAISVALGLVMAFMLSTAAQAQGPALTTISDTVYRADGTPAEGTVLISWPTFQSAQGDAVAAGNLSVAIGAQGAFTAQLVPNVELLPQEHITLSFFSSMTERRGRNTGQSPRYRLRQLQAF